MSESPCTGHRRQIKLSEPSRVMSYVHLPPKRSTGGLGLDAFIILNYCLKSRRGVKGEQL